MGASQYELYLENALSPATELWYAESQGPDAWEARKEHSLEYRSLRLKGTRACER